MKDDTISRAAAIEAVHKYWIAEVHKLPRKMVGEYEVLDGDYKTPTIHNKKICEAIEALPSAQTEQRWIPCGERLPYAEYGESDTVFATCGYRGVEDTSVRWTMDLYFNGGVWCYPTGETYDQKVYAWMEKPKPYTGEDGENG